MSNADVVRIELERITAGARRNETAILFHRHRQPRDGTAVFRGEIQLPMHVAIRMRLETKRR